MEHLFFVGYLTTLSLSGLHSVGLADMGSSKRRSQDQLSNFWPSDGVTVSSSNVLKGLRDCIQNVAGVDGEEAG